MTTITETHDRSTLPLSAALKTGMLGGSQLAKWASANLFGGSPKVEYASIDLTLSATHRRLRPINPDTTSTVDPADIWGEPEEAIGALTIMAGESLLLATAESMSTPTTNAAMLLSKSSIGRRLLTLGHVGFVDPGFGTDSPTPLTFQLTNNSPIAQSLEIGKPIVQMIVFFVPESGNYADQAQSYSGTHGPTPVRTDS